MRLSLLVAADEQGGIGLGDGLPWRLPDDLKRFKQLTMGHHIIMGRKTYETIRRPLPGRTMIVISRSRNYQAPGCQVVQTLPQALKLARWAGESEAFIIGGAQIFALALPQAERIYLTRVHAITPADVHFPEVDFSAWRCVQTEPHPADERHAFVFTFEIWDRAR